MSSFYHIYVFVASLLCGIAYMMFHPRETNLSAIARGAGVNRHTAAKHYELIREMVGYG